MVGYIYILTKKLWWGIEPSLTFGDNKWDEDPDNNHRAIGGSTKAGDVDVPSEVPAITWARTVNGWVCLYGIPIAMWKLFKRLHNQLFGHRLYGWTQFEWPKWPVNLDKSWQVHFKHWFCFWLRVSFPSDVLKSNTSPVISLLHWSPNKIEKQSTIEINKYAFL